ncbi:MAG: multiheme c-type cytochrome [Candidatus Hydrogenedentota bacterium]
MKSHVHIVNKPTVMLVSALNVAKKTVFALFVFAGIAISAGIQGQEALHGVCPPFHLRDEQGNIINPVTGENGRSPYSPKQTCGQCHDYDLITQGYHFTQGAGEEPTEAQAARCQWALTPGNYGGTWCSPAPLYRYLSKKRNESPAEMDMTSFSFLTAGCAVCHPGGGSAEYDREGKRYDRWMADPASGFTPGGDNNFDGDYYQAKWSESGVLEADCLLCHLPEYDFKARKKQLDAQNFRCAPSVGAGLATVSGSVAEGKPVIVAYNVSKFGEDGTLAPRIIREPRNETCLACHAKPGWKKRGANFRARTDVHLRAGLKCVDCHPAGSLAVDERIRGKEVHQFGKGDDPGGHVRDDLDNTMRDCADCHDTGYLGAPVAKHRGLPPLHLDKIACQTCHIPERSVKAALMVASDVFNPGAKIPSKGKHLWTFYGPGMAYWNHYGDLEMMGYDDKPTDPYRPVLARYDGKIYPVNRIHNTWPAIETEGKEGLQQPKMGAVYKMWTAHQKDPAVYPSLALITDDNGDGVIEVNRTEEIDALIAAITEMLQVTGYPMEGKRVVWVMNDRIYRSGTEYRTIPMHAWEASPYANVHKYSHDVYPATAALGSNGCTDCHSPESDFFFASVVKYPFDDNAEPVTRPQYEVLGLSGSTATLGAWREAYLKPALHLLLILLGVCLAVVLAQLAIRRVLHDQHLKGWVRFVPAAVGIYGAVVGVYLFVRGDLADYALPLRFWLDRNHFLAAMLILSLGFCGLCWRLYRQRLAGHSPASYFKAYSIRIVLAAVILTVVSGTLLLLQFPVLDPITRLSYTVLDLALAAVLLGTIFIIAREIVILSTTEKEQAQ